MFKMNPATVYLCPVVLSLLIFDIQASPRLSNHPVVLVVSFDGFRYDYMTKTETPNLRKLQEEGVSVPWMTAQFPTNTFPNHHSIATGLYPDDHGVTDNSLFDPLHGKNFSGFDDDPEFWNYHPDVLPFYIRNDLAGGGRYSGAYMWAGSSIAYGESFTLRPTYYIPTYNGSVPWETRVETVISWITDKDKPANIVFLYHNEPDSGGHAYGTDDDRVLEVIKQVDTRAGQLVTMLKDAGIYEEINLVILSDHGMQTVPPENKINPDSIVDRNLYFRTSGGSTLYHIWPRDPVNLDMIYNAFKNASQFQGFKAFKKQELGQFPYHRNRRVGDVLLLPDPGYAFTTSNNGVHGYDPSFMNMSAFFLARGPLFKQGFASNSPIQNIDLVPLFSNIMGVPSPSNGSLERIEWVLNAGSDVTIRTTPIILIGIIVTLWQ